MPLLVANISSPGFLDPSLFLNGYPRCIGSGPIAGRAGCAVRFGHMSAVEPSPF